MGKSNQTEDVFNMFLKGIWKMIKYISKGIKKVRTPIPIIGLFISIVAVYIAYLNKNKILNIETLLNQNVPLPIRYLFYWLLLLIPLFYLMFLGSIKDISAEMFYKIFADIKFIGKDEKYPYLLSQKQDGKKTIYTFKSHIPLNEWTKAKDLLETGFDCNIRIIREGSNKKTVELVTVPSSYKIKDLIIWNDSLIRDGDGVLAIGESDLDVVSFDLNKTPHVLAAGETGSGKSVTLRCVLWQMINKGCRTYMIDFKGGVEFGKAYERYGEVITERDRALVVLQKLTKENEARLKLFRDLEVKNLKEYNQKTNSNLCRIGVFIDEIAEMLDKKGVPKEDKVVFEQLEKELSTLARLSRATGINLILGVQRPDANVLTGQIKNNIPVRISGRFADKAASEIVLGNTSACNLPEKKGRFLYKVGNETVEFQSYFFDDEKNLHDIDVKPGDMLTEKNSYKAEPEQLQQPVNKGFQNEDSKDFDLDLNFDK